MPRRSFTKELFKNYDLCEIEVKTGLPIRLAYLALAHAADRNGCFKWKPNQLKIDILPLDNIDMSQILEELEKIEFIKSYEVNNTKYGYIVNWKTEQSVHPHEKKSKIPPPEI